MWWYDFGIAAFGAGIRTAALWKPKAKLWARGRRGLFARLSAAVKPGGRIVWVHASSLGEFEQGRPVMEEIRRLYPEYKILLTFFSPSGYEIRRDYSGADYVFYIPLDTKRNVRRFLDTVRPEAAIFVKYDFWLNFLSGLRKQGCPTYIISSVFREDSVFFRPYGGAFRKALGTFEHLFVQDAQSAERLAGIGVRNVTVAGDTRFDRVARIASAAKELPAVERFVAGRRALAAGSTWPQDEELLVRLINDNPDTAFIVAPHEIDRVRIESFASACRGGAVLYTECAEGASALNSLPAAQVLVIDTIGILSSVYRYARWGYIGGGFGAGIHNTLEAAVYGLPLAFGPNWSKFREAAHLIDSGAARSVRNYEELSGWFSALKSDDSLSDEAGLAAARYVSSHCGATDIILKAIFGGKS